MHVLGQVWWYRLLVKCFSHGIMRSGSESESELVHQVRLALVLVTGITRFGIGGEGCWHLA